MIRSDEEDQRVTHERRQRLIQPLRLLPVIPRFRVERVGRAFDRRVIEFLAVQHGSKDRIAIRLMPLLEAFEIELASRLLNQPDHPGQPAEIRCRRSHPGTPDTRPGEFQAIEREHRERPQWKEHNAQYRRKLDRFPATFPSPLSECARPRKPQRQRTRSATPTHRATATTSSPSPL